MRAVVIYESMFGNTKTVAEAVAEGLRAAMPVDLLEVGAAPRSLGEDVDLLIIGGPTHAFGLSRQSTREDAAGKATGPLVSTGIGLREWLAGLGNVPAGTAAAAFDTHIHKPRVPGSAARAAHRQLRRLGFRLVAPAESFYVTDSAGPLLTGEEERARAWAQRLAAATASPV